MCHTAVFYSLAYLSDVGLLTAAGNLIDTQFPKPKVVLHGNQHCSEFRRQTENTFNIVFLSGLPLLEDAPPMYGKMTIPHNSCSLFSSGCLVCARRNAWWISVSECLFCRKVVCRWCNSLDNQYRWWPKVSSSFLHTNRWCKTHLISCLHQKSLGLWTNALSTPLCSDGWWQLVACKLSPCVFAFGTEGWPKVPSSFLRTNIFKNGSTPFPSISTVNWMLGLNIVQMLWKCVQGRSTVRPYYEGVVHVSPNTLALQNYQLACTLPEILHKKIGHNGRSGTTRCDAISLFEVLVIK